MKMDNPIKNQCRGVSRYAPTDFIAIVSGGYSSSELVVLEELAGSLSVEDSFEDFVELSPRESWPEGDR
jgi:hypothetical protein